jgi:hypothetical protein
MEFDLGATLTWLDQHDAAHPKPALNCEFCQRPQSPEPTVKAELAESLGRKPTRAEVAADGRMIAWDARRQYELLGLAAQCGVQPKV